jgi:hypothetical protein
MPWSRYQWRIAFVPLGQKTAWNLNQSELCKVIVPCNRPLSPRGELEVQLYSFLTFGARWLWMSNFMSRQLSLRERDRLLIVQKVGWAPEQFFTGAENLAPTGIRSPDRQPVLSCYTHYAIPALWTLWSGEMSLSHPDFNHRHSKRKHVTILTELSPVGWGKQHIKNFLMNILHFMLVMLRRLGQEYDQR